MTFCKLRDSVEGCSSKGNCTARSRNSHFGLLGLDFFAILGLFASLQEGSEPKPSEPDAPVEPLEPEPDEPSEPSEPGFGVYTSGPKNSIFS